MWSRQHKAVKKAGGTHFDQVNGHTIDGPLTVLGSRATPNMEGPESTGEIMDEGI